MADAEEAQLQAKYAKDWQELKHLLVSKHFSGVQACIGTIHRSSSPRLPVLCSATP